MRLPAGLSHLTARTASSVFRCQRNREIQWSGSSRNLASVKELTWCAPSLSPTRRRHNVQKEVIDSPEEVIPIDKFGIVAAMSRNHVIGVNGTLPWKLPSDRMYFKHLTKGKVLILGRRTLLEDSKLRHIAHASRVIVLSRTVAEEELTALQACHSDLSLSFSIARSFPKALDLARRLEYKKDPDGSTKEGNAPSSQIECWVVGGERVYHEAVLHPSADRLHLTVVDIDVDERNGSISRFPAKYRWDNKFQLLSSSPQSDAGVGLSYRIDVYRRLKGRR